MERRSRRLGSIIRVAHRVAVVSEESRASRVSLQQNAANIVPFSHPRGLAVCSVSGRVLLQRRSVSRVVLRVVVLLQRVCRASLCIFTSSSALSESVA